MNDDYTAQTKSLAMENLLDSEIMQRLLEKNTFLAVPTLTTENEIQKVKGAALVMAPSERVFEVASALEDYPSFMPYVEKVEILQKLPDGVVTAHKLKMGLGVFSIKLQYELAYRLDPKGRAVTFVHHKGAMPSLEGSWDMVEASHGDSSTGRTVLVYSLRLDFKEVGLLVRKLLEAEPSMQNALLISTVMASLEAVKKRAEGSI